MRRWKREGGSPNTDPAAGVEVQLVAWPDLEGAVERVDVHDRPVGPELWRGVMVGHVHLPQVFGARLRALYGAVQDEGVPDQLLDLLEKLDNAEQQQKSKNAPRDGE